jgi:quinolinate synthase
LEDKKMNKKDETLVAEILKIKKEKDYLIMAHNYQLPEIQDLADVTGDSLELAKKAATGTQIKRCIGLKAKFSGSHFSGSSKPIDQNAVTGNRK